MCETEDENAMLFITEAIENGIINGENVHEITIQRMPKMEIEEVSSDRPDTREKSQSMDSETIHYLLSLRLKYDNMFTDKKSSKLKVWQKIAVEMSLAGFELGINAGEKCRQKFANIKKRYMAYITNTKQKSGPIAKPMYFDMLHTILENQIAINSTVIVDSMEEYDIASTSATTSESEIPETQIDDCNDQSSSAFTNTKKKTKAETAIVTAIKEMVGIQKEILIQIKEQTAIYNEQLHRQNEINNNFKERFLNILEESLKPSRKRRRSDSDLE